MVEVNGISNLTAVSVDLNGIGHNIPATSSLGICYGTVAGGPYPNCTPHTIVGDGSLNQPFSYPVSSLSPNTQYYFVVHEYNDATNTIIDTSLEGTFTTPNISVTCTAAVGNSTTGGQVTATETGGLANQILRLEYSLTSGGPFTIAQSVTLTGISPETYTLFASGLTPNTQYFTRTVLYDTDGTTILAQSGECTFTTNAPQVSTLTTNKNTAGAATRLVGDVITSTVVVDATSFSSEIENIYSFPDMSGFTVTQGSAAWFAQPQQFSSILDGIAFTDDSVDSTIEKTYTVAPNNKLRVGFGGYLSDDAASNYVVEFLDGATVVATSTNFSVIGDFGPELTPPITSGSFTLRITRLAGAPITQPQSSNDCILLLNVNEFGTEIVDFVDNVPATPTGTTRTWTAVVSGANGAVTPPATSGTGNISHLGMEFTGNATITYTIQDTVTAEGLYQNTATASSNLTANPINATGQLVTIEDTVDPPVAANLCKTDLVRICTMSNPVKMCSNGTPILFHAVAGSDGDVIPTTSTEFVAVAGMGVFTTIGFVRSYYTDLHGVLLAPQPTVVTAECESIKIDPEIVCLVPNGSVAGTQPISGVAVYDVSVNPPTATYYIGNTNVTATHTQTTCVNNQDYEIVETCQQEALNPAQKYTRVDWFERSNLTTPIQTIYQNQTTGVYSTTTPIGVEPCNQVETDLVLGSTALVCIENPVGTFTQGFVRDRNIYNNITLVNTPTTEYSTDGITWSTTAFTGTVRPGACPIAQIDRELICYITTANPTPQQAWAVHNNDFVGVAAPFIDSIGGIAYFTATNPVAPLILAQAGFQFVPCNDKKCTETKTIKSCFTPTDTLLARRDVFAHYSVNCDTALTTLLGYTLSEQNDGAYINIGTLDGGGTVAEGKCPCCSLGLPIITLDTFGVTDGGNTVGPAVSTAPGENTLTQVRQLPVGRGCSMPVTFTATRVSGTGIASINTEGEFSPGGVSRWRVNVSWDFPLDIQIGLGSYQVPGEVFVIVPGTDPDVEQYIPGAGAPLTFVNGTYTDNSGPSFLGWSGRTSISYEDGTDNAGHSSRLRFLQAPSAQASDCGCCEGRGVAAVRSTCAATTNTNVAYSETVKAVIDQVVNVRLCETTAGATTELDVIRTNWLPICIDNVLWFVQEATTVNNTTGTESASVKWYKLGANGTPTTTAPANIANAVQGDCTVGDIYGSTVFDLAPNSTFTILPTGNLVSWLFRNRNISSTDSTVQVNAGQVLDIDPGEELGQGSLEEKDSLLNDTVVLTTGASTTLRITILRKQ